MQCLCRNPDDRTSAQELLSHPFLDEPDDPELFKHPSMRVSVAGAGGDGGASGDQPWKVKGKKVVGKLPWDASGRSAGNAQPSKVIDNGTMLSVSESGDNIPSVSRSGGDDSSDDDDADAAAAARYRNGPAQDTLNEGTVRSLPPQATASWIRGDIELAIAGGLRMDTADFEAFNRADDE